MTNVYVTRAGHVGIIRGEGTMPGSVEIMSSDGTRFASLTRVIITAIGYNQTVNAQFLQTLDNAIYIYSFGDRVGEVQIQGLAFAGLSCSQDNGSGVVDILEYYKNYRLSKTGLPIRVAIGTEVIKGYLMGCRVNTQSAETGTYSWALELAAIPDQSDAAVGAGSDSGDSSSDSGEDTSGD
jgi:hypothetical protein